MRMSGDGCQNGTDNGTGIGSVGALVTVKFFLAVVLAMVFWVMKKKIMRSGWFVVFRENEGAALHVHHVKNSMQILYETHKSVSF